MLEILEASLERGCQTYVTGNAATNCRLDFVQEQVRAFRERAEPAGVTLIDAMHYGMEKPPQLAMAEWFRARGLDAGSCPTGRSSAPPPAAFPRADRGSTVESMRTRNG